jgi:hypothetical protein
VICCVPRNALDLSRTHATSSYIALSYAWGINVRYANIELNGSPFPVAKNLWDFLFQMRSDNLYAVYWIDAICIN